MTAVSIANVNLYQNYTGTGKLITYTAGQSVELPLAWRNKVSSLVLDPWMTVTMGTTSIKCTGTDVCKTFTNATGTTKIYSLQGDPTD